MALAILTPLPPESADERLFRFDIGVNRFYTFALSESTEAINRDGLRVLRTHSYLGTLLGPLPDSALGRGTLRVPTRLLPKGHETGIQLYSFRTATRIGPALSPILRVAPVTGNPLNNHLLPDLPRTRSLSVMNDYPPTAFSFAENRPFQHRELPYSEGLFLQELLQLVPKLLPSLMTLFGGNKATSSPVVKQVQSMLTPENTQLLGTLLRSISGGSGGAVAAPAVPGLAMAGAQAGAGSSEIMAYAATADEPYSQAQVLPLLALAPLIGQAMPLLQQVLTPETIGRVLDAPQKMVGAVTDGIMNLSRLGAEESARQLNAIMNLANAARNSTDALLNAMSLSLEQGETRIAYRRSQQVQLNFASNPTVTMAGKARALFARNREIGFKMAVITPKPITSALLYITVKHPQKLTVLAEKKYKVANVQSGDLTTIASLTVAELKALTPNEDYLLTAHLVWKTAKGESVGAVKTQTFCVTDGLFLDHVEETGEVVALNNVEQHRAFWHKVWETTLTANVRKYDIDGKYYTLLEAAKPVNGRMETLTRPGKPDENTGVVTMQLKSGMQLSLSGLNDLLPRISSYPRLTDAELKAIQAADFTERFHKMARTSLSLRGLKGDSVALWTFPELRLMKVVVSEGTDTDALGSITRLSPRVLYFPVPVDVHFVGLKTQR